MTDRVRPDPERERLLDAMLADHATSLDDEFTHLRDRAAAMSGSITESLARAIVKGKELDGLLAKLVLDQSNAILTQSLDPLYGLVRSGASSLTGELLNIAGGALSGAMGIGEAPGAAQAATVNILVNATDVGSFLQSETQMASQLYRVMGRKGRGG